MRTRNWIGAAVGMSVLTICGALAIAQQAQPAQPAQPVEQERKVKENEVPAAALAALKKLAGSNAITEFEEEIEHGTKFYEASWKGADGEVEAEVTEAGDVVEIEETMSADKVPAAVRAAAEKHAAGGAKLSYERKTVYLYEISFTKDGKGHEAMFGADGRSTHDPDDGDDADDQGEDDKKKK